jgi:hypothetical protein
VNDTVKRIIVIAGFQPENPAIAMMGTGGKRPKKRYCIESFITTQSRRVR